MDLLVPGMAAPGAQEGKLTPAGHRWGPPGQTGHSLVSSKAEDPLLVTRGHSYSS